MKELTECKNLYGPLPERDVRMLISMVHQPSNEIWELARRVVISAAPVMTLDMAVKLVAPPNLGQIPDAFTVRRAIRYAVRAQKGRRGRQPHWR